eukprot:gene20619-22654_t
MGTHENGSNWTNTYDRNRASSLFSFELFINSIHNISVECSLPAVAFRLLDFPTVIIYQKNKEHVKQILENDSNSESSNLPSNITYCTFNKGKSSLFNMDFNRLFNLLSNVPVYTMLLDVLGHSKPKLLGSCSISLKKGMDELRSHVKSNGFIMPANYKKNSKLNVFNLMGTVIAQLDITYTLYSYGDSLSSHIRASKMGSFSLYYGGGDKTNQSMKSAYPDTMIMDTSLKSEKLASKFKMIDAATETIPLCEDESSEMISTNALQERVANEVEEKLASDKRKDSIEKEQMVMSDSQYDIKNGIFCPPPLFYKPTKNIEEFELKRPGVGSMKEPKPGIQLKEGKLVVNDSESEDSRNALAYHAKVVKSNDDVYHEIVQPVTHENNTSISSVRGNHECDIKTVRESENQAKDSSQDSTELKHSIGSISDVIMSLNGLPLLQGILKEIVNFSKQIKNETIDEKHTSTMPKEHEILSPIISNHGAHRVSGKRIKDNSQGSALASSVNRKKTKTKQEISATSKRNPKVLQFKTTKTQQMRFALNARVSMEKEDVAKGNHQPSHGNTLVLNENKKNLNQMFIIQSKKSEKDVKVQNAKVQHHRHVTGSNVTESSSTLTSSQSAQSVKLPRHISGMQSKSPVSLEIRLPSALDVIEDEVIVNESNDNASSTSHSGEDFPAPLQRNKWMGNEDLSKLADTFGDNEEGSEKYDRPDTVLSSRASELIRLMSESDENEDVSYHDTGHCGGSHTRDQPSFVEEEILERKSRNTACGYTTDDFDDISSESSHSAASHSVASHSGASHSVASHSGVSHSVASHSGASHSVASHSGASHSVASRLNASRSATRSVSSNKSNESRAIFQSDSLNSKLPSSPRSKQSKMRSLSNESISPLKSDVSSQKNDSIVLNSSRLPSPKSDSLHYSRSAGSNEREPVESGSIRSVQSDVISYDESLSSREMSGVSHQESYMNKMRASQNISPAASKNKYRRDEGTSEKSVMSLSADILSNKIASLKNKTPSDANRRPVTSVHSPTASRSQRTKLRQSSSDEANGGDMTHSINLSNLSLNTGSEYDSIDMDELDRELQSPEAARKGPALL